MRIGEISTKSENFYAKVCVKSKWTEDADLSQYDPVADWNPRLYVENGLRYDLDQTSYSVSLSGGETVVTETKIIQGRCDELKNISIDAN